MTTDPVASALDSAAQAKTQLLHRLDGLSDNEYQWEPAPGCWSIRDIDGTWVAELDPARPEPGPITTIAWRLWHLAVDCMDSYSARILGASGSGLPDDQFVGTAAEAITVLDTSIDHFVSGMASMGDDIWLALGADWGSHADRTGFDLLLHANRELMHHGAEIALLRDLYRALAINQDR